MSGKITFVLGQGGLGSTTPGQDYISGIIFTANTLPSGFSYSVGQEITSLNSAVALGIVGTYADETKPSANIAISATVSAGTIITVTVTEPGINSTTNLVSLASYTAQSTDTTTNTLATNIANAINIGSSGYSAGTPAGASFSLTGRVGIGPLVNSTSAVVTGVSATVTSFSSGVASQRILEYYQISEFFRMNPTGILWVMYQSSVGTWTNINLLQNQANNTIRQFGAYNIGATTSTTFTTDLDNLQTQGNTLFSNYSPASMIYAPNILTTSTLTTLPNLRTRSDSYVSCVIGQDGGNTGAYLNLYAAQSVPCYGAVLGAVSSALVSNSIAWVGQFPFSSGSGELSIPAISNGNLYSTLNSNQPNTLTQLDGYGYIYLETLPNYLGTFVNNSSTCISLTSNYSYIERVRTIDKAVRNSYLELIPLVNSPLILNSNGTLASTTITMFEDAEKPSMDAMVIAGEISAYSIQIDPTQNVQSSGNINVLLEIVMVGVARNIIVTIGYVLSI